MEHSRNNNIIIHIDFIVYKEVVLEKKRQMHLDAPSRNQQST